MTFPLWFAAMVIAVSAIYKDQIGKFDWLDLQIIGCLKDLFFTLSFICLLNNKTLLRWFEEFSK